jgi:hypothetical protein
MASFYLGLIYYIRADYGNARGAFENALFKLHDVDPDNKKDAGHDVQSNFALASLMLAKSYQHLGREDLARANFDYVANNNRDLASLANYERNADANLLLVIDYGHGPHKVANGDGAVVGFAPNPMEEGPIPPPRVIVDGKRVETDPFVRPPVDLLAMAQDRKWQSIDTLRAIKSAVGTGLLIGSAVEGIRGINGEGARQRTDLMVAGGLAAAGLLLKATSQADIRQWEMLPRATFIVPLHVDPGTHDVTVEFPGPYGGVRQTWRHLAVPESRGEATYYFRMQKWNEGPFDWPPASLHSNAGAVMTSTASP